MRRKRQDSKAEQPHYAPPYSGKPPKPGKIQSDDTDAETGKRTIEYVDADGNTHTVVLWPSGAAEETVVNKEKKQVGKKEKYVVTFDQKKKTRTERHDGYTWVFDEDGQMIEETIVKDADEKKSESDSTVTTTKWNSKPRVVIEKSEETRSFRKDTEGQPIQVHRKKKVTTYEVDPHYKKKVVVEDVTYDEDGKHGTRTTTEYKDKDDKKGTEKVDKYPPKNGWVPE